MSHGGLLTTLTDKATENHLLQTADVRMLSFRVNWEIMNSRSSTGRNDHVSSSSCSMFSFVDSFVSLLNVTDNNLSLLLFLPAITTTRLSFLLPLCVLVCVRERGCVEMMIEQIGRAHV